MTMTFIAALRHDGIAAPYVFDGPINGERFLAWVQQMLVPVLKPGDVVILDNLSSHKALEVRKAIRKAKARLFFSRLTARISIRLSKYSQSSKGCSERQKNEPRRRHGDGSEP